MRATVSAHPRRRYNDPAYPTKLVVLATPELLGRHQPAAWLTNRDLAAVTGALLTACVVGCDRSPYAVAIVAPVFNHGDGVAERYAGHVGAPPRPMYLTEDEGRAIIREVLSSEGLSTWEPDSELADVLVRGLQIENGYEWVSAQPAQRGFDEARPLQADLHDPSHAIAIEFVTEDEFLLLGGSAERWEPHDLRMLASNVAAAVRNQGHGVIFGVFYDPVNYQATHTFDGFEIQQQLAQTIDPSLPRDDQFEALQAKWKKFVQDESDTAKRQSADLLRQQVRDFADWLKAQGVI